jgi:hypothetical protein
MAVQQAAAADCPSEDGGIILRPAATDEPPADDAEAASTLGDDGTISAAASVGSVTAPSRIDSGGGFLAEGRRMSLMIGWPVFVLAGLALLVVRQRRRRRA